MSLDTDWRTALRRSPLGLGGAPLGNLYRALSDADAVGVIQAALAEGVGYFDTAPHYGNGRSEQRFGMALRDVTRERFLLSTKVGRLLERDADAPRDEHGYVDVLPFVQHYDYSYGGTLRALDASRERLRLAAQVPALLTMLERNPDLDVVIDHGAKPDIAGGAWQPWADFMRAVAASPRVYCKLSGLATEAAASWSADTLRPYVAHLCECFGPQRLMWGSDWPVVLLGGGYARWHAAAGALLAELSSDERGAVLGDNARRFYALDVESAPRPG